MGKDIRTGYLHSGYGKEANKMKHVTVAIAVVGIVCISFLAQGATAATPAMSVEPPCQKVSPGDEFTVDIYIGPEGTVVGGADYKLIFNNTLLNGTLLTKGTFFDGFATWEFGEGINNTAGWVDYGESITTGGGVTTPGTLTTITFEAIGEGISELVFEIATLSDPDGVKIPNVTVNNGSVEIAQPSTPFFIFGRVFYDNGSDCKNPKVNITNLNTSIKWQAETIENSNYYQRMLTPCTDVVAGDILQFNVTSPDGTQLNITEHPVTLEAINGGGLFNVNVTLGTMNAQRWYLTPEGKPVGAPPANDSLDHVKDNLMHKGSGSGTGTYFNLNYTEVAWFYADTGAECELGFGEQPWEAHIRTEAIDGDEIERNLTVEICRLDNGTGNVTVIASHMQQLTAVGSKHLWNITCEDNESSTQDFSTGDWLAVRLSWDCATDELQIYYNATAGSDSYIESPAADPGYPIPELPTIILFGVGLLVIAGYVGLRTKRGD